jgi:predicted nucleotidyltransferase component of viral defense system
LAKYDFVFKGGTYLWFCYKISRFSEDLDFTARQEISKDLPDTVVQYLALYNIVATYTKIKDDKVGFSFRINAQGPLYRGTNICYIYVEISRRELSLLPVEPQTVETPLYNLPVTIISGMNLNEVFAEKVRAILTREKARDIYDLYFLICYKKIMPNFKLINKKLEYVKLKYNKEQFFESVEKKEKIYLFELRELVFDKLPDFKEVYDTIRKAFESTS